jgi:hypothetical protein
MRHGPQAQERVITTGELQRRFPGLYKSRTQAKRAVPVSNSGSAP